MINKYWVSAKLMIASAIVIFVTVVGQAQQRGFGGGQNRGGGGGGGGGRATGGGLGSSGTRQYNSNGTVGEAMISSDPETRRLIVITDEETSGFISQVITNLDRPKPQVLIKVIFLEVTYQNNYDVGVEGGTARKLGSGADAPKVGISNMFGLAAQGAANSFGTPGAGLYSLGGSDWQVTLRAIEQKGSLEVLSRPSILARNNQQASILVGQEIPLITNVRFDTVGNQINTVQYQDVGIILRVTPFITSDNMVEMIVSPEISALDQSQTIPISTGVVAPVINKRSADTVVVTPDGQPVVIGGLMQNTKTTTDTKIPLLGDIPGLGNLFKHKQKAGTKTELMIFLTPHIVMQPTQLAKMSGHEEGATVLAPKAFPEEELNRFIDRLPVKASTPPEIAPEYRGKAPKKKKRSE
jgi:general secretion pathway protein D